MTASVSVCDPQYWARVVRALKADDAWRRQWAATHNDQPEPARLDLDRVVALVEAASAQEAS